ncbi:putative type IX secretion system sortase PorU2 [Dyadobacter psychrotolerans]|uniref:putative type IX secretion system sortase PorU2 n=1 Tax=Dyadobacter psychrotolerans TaxID=2541721 RepID=UPI001E2CA020|nr:C25 family cysteine peptidase [Dyadobacter psychrotolerans]
MSGRNQKYKSFNIKNTFRIRRAGICLSFILFAFISSRLQSQPLFGDEWINVSQTYLRIPITQTGFYKITSQELRSAGLPLDNITAASIQMFRRGKELAIEVESDTSGMSGFNGSIGFYGQRNDGMPDSAFYVKPEAIPHLYYSLYSDTAAYFLTWRLDGLSGKRIAKSPVEKSTQAINYHYEETSALFNSHYSTGNFYPLGTGFEDGTALTAYDTGEGWTGKELNYSWQTVDINTSNLLSENIDQIEIELVIVGRKAGQHEVEIHAGNSGNLGRQINTIKFSDYQPVTYSFHLTRDDMGKALQNGKLVFSVYAKKGTISVSHVKWRYPQKTTLTSAGSQNIFHFNSASENTFWEIGNANGWRFYDCSDPYNLRKLNSTESGIETTGARSVIGLKETLKAVSLKTIHFQPINTLQTDYLIISHPLVRKPVDDLDPVAAYALYRASKEGGGYKTIVINSEEIFDRFNYGEPGPSGIRNMINRLFQNGKLKFVFIIGHSIDPQTARKLRNARSVDMVPNAGWPGSDLALSVNLNKNQPFVPIVPIGRINAETPEQVWTYLQKVRAMEAQPVSAPWRKNILHLSGGRSASERVDFRGYVNSFEKTISNSSLGASVQTLSKRNDSEVEQFPLFNYLNKGLALMTLYGHSGIDVSDIDLGYASDESRKYQNDPFYPAVIVNGCAIGSIFYSNKTISTDWIFSQKNGAVLFLAHTFNGVSSSLKHYTDAFYEVLADSAFTSEPFGTIQKEAIRRNMLAYPTLSDGITAQQMNLHGDPAIRIFPAKLPDYTFDSTAITITDVSGKQLTSWSDSISIRIGVLNNGRFKKENCKLTIKATDASLNTFSYPSLFDPVVFADTLIIKTKNPFRNPGECSIAFTLDPDNALPEEIESNNSFEKKLLIPQGGAFPLLPPNGHSTSQREIELIAQIPFDRNTKTIIFEWDTVNTFSSSQKNTASVNNFTAIQKITFSDKSKKFFWRVYIPGGENRPLESRSVIYDPDFPNIENLPEGIAFLQQAIPPEIQEGEQFTANIYYQNISKTAFKDSVDVFVTHSGIKKNERFKIKGPALSANDVFDLPLSFLTLGETGAHQISVTFNSKKLPEEIYTNNQIQFSYQVIPDRIKPILHVSIDDRLLADGDFVSAEPVVGIQLIDENKFLIRNDTTDIEVWLTKDCLTCKEQKISLSEAIIHAPAPNDFRILLTLANLPPGSYRLRVKAMDLSGNQVPDYIINFNISDQVKLINAGVGPNPSGDWFRFYVDLETILPENEIVITVYDLQGREFKRISGTLHAGKNEWFWFPENLPVGIYLYRMELKGGNAVMSSVAIEGPQGKLIWVR